MYSQQLHVDTYFAFRVKDTKTEAESNPLTFLGKKVVEKRARGSKMNLENSLNLEMIIYEQNRIPTSSQWD